MTRISQIPESARPVQQQSSGKTDGDLFKKTLTDALDKTAGSQSSATASASSLGELQAPSFQTIQNTPAYLADKTDELASQMEKYANALGNPESTLREIEPLIESIRSDAQKLKNEADSTLASDDNLRQIANEFAVTAGVEYMKFKRGDYV